MDIEEKIKAYIHDLNTRIELLMKEYDISKDDIKKDMKARLDELKRNRDYLSQQVEKLRTGNVENLKSAEKVLKEVVQEINDLFYKTFSSKSKK
ncbi:MAG: hypothetical protein ACFCUU_04150 [Cyclobacteriaceae bacterium]